MRADARVRDLLYAKWCIIRNLPKSQTDYGWVRSVVVLGLGLAVWFGIFGASRWFLGQTLALEPFGEILVRKLLSMTFLMIFAMLLFSSLISAFSTFLLSDELRFLVVKPLPPNAFFAARFMENTAYASWMVVLFGLPIFVAAGIEFGAGAAYYAWLAVILVPYIAIPSGLSAILVVLLANILPVHRTKEILVGIGAIVFVSMFFIIRGMGVEKLFNPDAFGSTMELFSSLQTPGKYWLPSSWAIELLYPQLSQTAFRLDWLLVGLLYSSALGLFFVGAWTFRLGFARAYSRSREGGHQEAMTRDNQGGKAMRTAALKHVSRWSQKNAENETDTSPLFSIAAKDIRVFRRDTVQWSQLLMLGGLVAIYLVNFRFIGDIGKGGIFGPVGLYILNLALSGFLVAAVSVRLVFPAVSLEGKAFWLIRQAPISMRRYLMSKWLGQTPFLLLLAEILTVLSNWMIGSSWVMTAGAVVLVALLSFSLAGLGVGLGAMFPRFHIDNAAKIATGIGGVLYMLVGIGMTVGIVTLSVYPTYQWLKHSMLDMPLPDGFALRTTLCWLGVVFIALSVPFTAITIGARRLSRR